MSTPVFKGIIAPSDGDEPQSMTKSTFESLGIVMDNGKPRFRLNEPVFSTGACSMRSRHFNQDEDEETSFVVLGKSSMDFINAASLADYEQIKEQSLAVDTSIVSTLSPEEIEKKVVELLQENQKLKDTLSQNNNTMKHHFNTLAIYQQELKKVHENHKQKFAETRDMITLLKNENTELKTKLTMETSMISSKFSGEMVGESMSANRQKNIEYPSLLAEKSPSSTIVSDDSQASTKSSVTQDVQSLPNEESSLTRIILKKSLENHNTQYQQEIIHSLKEQIRLLSENSFTPLQLNVDSEKSEEKYRKQFLDNFTHYNEKLATLARCYTEQMSRFTEIQECLKGCIETLDYYENFEPTDLTLDTRLNHKQLLDEARDQLIKEQLKNINERQNLIKAQKLFESIFSDYNAALHELEILREENSKPVERKASHEPGKLDVLRERKSLEEAREAFELERKSFLAEKMLFELERESLNGEKASLDSQSMLYEAQMKSLRDDNKVLEKRHDDLLTEITSLRMETEKKDIEMQRLRALAKNHNDDIDHLRAQIEAYKLDFEEEKISRQDLLSQREELSGQLGKMREYNQQLLQRLNGPNPATLGTTGEQHNMSPDGFLIDAFCETCGLGKMPGQWHGPGLCQPRD
ncbi:optineurin-like [Diachasmimorpha longicaudata]|uniref:optineurin-like n=1 Tax=Diachasmimorpha longicaudata TaxID=58733 RepID=UPI0030B87B6F